VNKIINKLFVENSLISWVIRISLVGSIIAIILSVWWLQEISRHCGVVRFYEYIMVWFIIGSWLAGTILGLVISFIAGHKKASTLLIIGFIITMLATVGLVLVGAKIIYNITTHNQVQHNLFESKKIWVFKTSEKEAIEA